MGPEGVERILKLAKTLGFNVLPKKQQQQQNTHKKYILNSIAVKCTALNAGPLPRIQDTLYF